MSKFKIGDKIKVNNHRYNNGDILSTRKGNIYTVYGVSRNCVILSEHTSEGLWYESRFDLVEEENFKVGDIIECKNQSGKNAITNDKQYTVAKYYDKTHLGLFANDRGVSGRYHERRFKLINRAENPKDELIKKDMEDKTIEEIKNFDKSVLEEANKEVLEEIANEKKEQAKKALRSLYNEKATLEKDAKEKNDKIKEITKDLKGISA